MPEPLSAEEERAWRALVRLMVVLPRTIDDDLHRRTGLRLTTYVVLMTLSESSGRQLPMSALAERSAVSASRMTRVVDGLEHEGLVVRRSSPDNHRVSLARLTDAGLLRLQQVWPDHLAGARRVVLDHLAGGELAPFTEVVTRLLAVAEGGSSPALPPRS